MFKTLQMKPLTVAIYAAIVLTTVAFKTFTNINETDVFLHTLLGDWILAGHSPSGNPAWTFPLQDTTSWTNTQGVSEVLFSLLHSSLGWWGVALISILSPIFLATTMIIMINGVKPKLRQPSNQIPAYFFVAATALLLYVFSSSMSVRPQTFSYILTPILMVFAYNAFTTGRMPKMYVLPLLTFVWCLLHGYGILVPPMMLTALIAYHISRIIFTKNHIGQFKTSTVSFLKALPCILLAFLATLITPAGFNIYTAAVRIREAAGSTISEWGSTSIVNPAFWLLTVSIVIYLGVSLYSFKKHHNEKRTIAAEIIFLTIISLGLATVGRSATLLAFIIILISTIRALKTFTRKSTSTFQPLTLKEARAGKIIAVTALILALAIPFVKFNNIQPNPQTYPTEFIQTINAQPGEHKIFTDYNLSSYILYELSQTNKGSTSIDGRVDLYGKTTLENYINLTYNKNLTETERNTLWQPYKQATDAIIYKNTPLYTFLLNNGYRVLQEQTAVNADGVETQIAWLVKQ